MCPSSNTITIQVYARAHPVSTATGKEAWIIERLDRKLADATGSNIVEKCDVMFSRAIQPLTSGSDVLRILFFIAYFIYTGCPCFEVKDEEELFLEKIV